MSSLIYCRVTLPDVLWKKLEKRAKQAGTTPSEYVRQLVDLDLRMEPLDEIVGPVRDDIRKRGITEEQVAKIIRRARKATRPKTRRAAR